MCVCVRMRSWCPDPERLLGHLQIESAPITQFSALEVFITASQGVLISEEQFERNSATLPALPVEGQASDAIIYICVSLRCEALTQYAHPFSVAVTSTNQIQT